MNLLNLVGQRLDNIYQIRRKCYYLSGWNYLRSKQGRDRDGFELIRSLPLLFPPLAPWVRGTQHVGRQQCSASADELILSLPRHKLWRVTAAPRSVARQTLPRHRSAPPVFATSSSRRVTMHGATQVFSRARAIGAGKSVSFKIKKPIVLDLKLNSKKG